MLSKISKWKWDLDRLGCAERKVIGREDNFSLFCRVPQDHSAKEIRSVFLHIEYSKGNESMGYDVSVSGHSPLFDNNIVGVLLQSGHKAYSLRSPVRENLAQLGTGRLLLTAF